jgi:hypothetical protein
MVVRNQPDRPSTKLTRHEDAIGNSLFSEGFNINMMVFQ